MPSLDDVTQRFTADTGPYIAAVRAAAAAAREFTAAALEAAAAARQQMDAMNGVDRSSAGAAVALRGAASAEGDLRNVTLVLNAILGELRNQTLLLAVSFTYLDDKLAALIAMMQAAKASASGLGDSMTGVAAKTAAAGAAAAAAGGGWTLAGRGIGFWIHVVVMGSLEILATAIPALVALGSAVAGMMPTFIRISDAMHNLVGASGSMTMALGNSIPPLQALGANMQRLRSYLAPDAYLIFGSVITALGSHIGAFASMAQQAGNVLAQFASKISTELQGSLGTTLIGLFKNAVGYMIQWGQLLGNLGHIFLIVFSNMAGVSHVLLGAFDGLTRVILAFVQLPLVPQILAAAFAFSALYRWVILLGLAWKFLGGQALVSIFTAVIATVVKMGFVFMAAGGGVDGLAAAFDVLWASIGPVGWAILAVTAIVGIFMLASHNATDSMDKLIGEMNKAPTSVASFQNNIDKMGRTLIGLSKTIPQVTNEFNRLAQNSFKTGGAIAAAGTQINNTTRNDIDKGITEIQKLSHQLLMLEAGYAQAGQRSGALGAGMNALEIQTALADSKIQQLNQAIDQYIQLVTGGMSALAQFATSMQNIGQIAATTSNNLGTSTTQLSLSAKQFGNALNSMSTVGSAAWNNFSQVLGSTMPNMMDWFRQAGVLSAASSGQMHAAVMSMIAIIGQYAGSNKIAQAQVMAFAAANGISYSKFSQLMQAAGPAGGALKRLYGIVGDVTINLSKMSQMAQNAATSLSSTLTQAIANNAYHLSGTDKALLKLQTDLLSGHSTNVQIAADWAGYKASLGIAMASITQTGNVVQNGMTHAQTATSTSTTAMGNSLNANSGNFNHLENIAKTTMGQTGQHVTDAASKTKDGSNKIATAADIAGHHMGLLAGSTITAMAKFNSAVDGALKHAQNLQNFIDTMHGTSITVTTNFVTTHSGGGSGCIPGITCAHGGVMGYATGGMVAGRYGQDAVPAMLTAGEAVLTARAVSALGGPLAIHNLNNTPSEAVTSGSFGRGDGAPVILGLNLGISNAMDGQVVNSIQRRATLIYNRRNPTNNLSLRNR